MPVPDQFHLFIQYYRQPTPLPEEWERDLKHIKRLGFTGVQLRPQWAWHEPKEGSFRWDDIDTLMALTAESGLKVLFKRARPPGCLQSMRPVVSARTAVPSSPGLAARITREDGLPVSTGRWSGKSRKNL